MSLFNEISQQPESMQRLLDTQMSNVSAIAKELKTYDPRYVFIVARGTSDHAGVYAKYLWGMRNGFPVALAAPSLFTLHKTLTYVEDAL